MSPWMLAVIMKNRLLVTETFASSRTWVAPLTTSKIESMTGEGADGTTTTDYYIESYVYYQYRRDGGPVLYTSDPEYTGRSVSTAGAVAPDGFCLAYESGEWGILGNERATCYTFNKTGETISTTGASTTGFGQTFAGGIGVTATPSTVTNVTITAGASYSLVIPSGGSLSITYYR